MERWIAEKRDYLLGIGNGAKWRVAGRSRRSAWAQKSGKLLDMNITNGLNGLSLDENFWVNLYYSLFFFIKWKLFFRDIY